MLLFGICLLVMSAMFLMLAFIAHRVVKGYDPVNNDEFQELLRQSELNAEYSLKLAYIAKSTKSHQRLRNYCIYVAGFTGGVGLATVTCTLIVTFL